MPSRCWWLVLTWCPVRHVLVVGGDLVLVPAGAGARHVLVVGADLVLVVDADLVLVAGGDRVLVPAGAGGRC